MAEQGLTIVEKDGVFHLSGVLNEYADFSAFLTKSEPLKLNLRHVSRLNSIGIRNMLKFLSDWGARAIEYFECPSEFIDQVNMIPALLGSQRHGRIVSFFVPYECVTCDHEDEVLTAATEVQQGVDGSEAPLHTCSECGSTMNVLSDSFLVFLSR